LIIDLCGLVEKGQKFLCVDKGSVDRTVDGAELIQGVVQLRNGSASEAPRGSGTNLSQIGDEDDEVTSTRFGTRGDVLNDNQGTDKEAECLELVRDCAIEFAFLLTRMKF